MKASSKFASFSNDSAELFHKYYLLLTPTTCFNIHRSYQIDALISFTYSQKINIKYQVYFIAWRFLFLSALKRSLQLLLREFIAIHVIETKYWTMQYKVQWNKKFNSILMIKIYSEPLRLRSIFTTCWARQKFPTFLWAITHFEELHVYTCSCASFGLWEISIAWRTQFLSCFDHFQGKVGAGFF